MKATTRGNPVRLLGFAVIPLVALVTLTLAYRGVQPLWAGGSTDPSYEYLLNSLMLAERRVPAKTDHPGITLEMAGAIALRARHAWSGHGTPLRDQVLTDPEPYLSAFVTFLLLLFAASSAFLGRAVWRLTGSAWMVGLAQLSPFVCFEVFRSLVQVMCEPLLLAAAQVLSGLILLAAVRPQEEAAGRLETGLGVVLGMGLATKAVFLPAALPAFFVARERAGWGRVALWSLLSFAACLLPMAPRVPETAGWMWRLFTHAGYHGSGAATVVDTSSYLPGLLGLLRAELPLHAAFVAAIAACLWPRWPDEFPVPARRAALGLLGAWVVTLAAAAKQPQAHYLVTLAGLLPASLVLALWRLRLAGGHRAAHAARGAIALALAAGAVHLSERSAWFLHMRAEVKAGARAVRAAAGPRSPAVLHAHRASSIPSALAAGNEWTELAYSADLRRLYPGFLAVDREGFHAFGEPATLRDVAAHVAPDGMALVQDSKWERLEAYPWAAGLPSETLASGGRDSLHRVRLFPSPAGADSGLWTSGMLVVAGLDGQAGTRRWATADRTSLAFLHEGGPAAIELSAGHALAGTQHLSVFANGQRLDRFALPALPETRRFTASFEAGRGWNEIAIVYDRTVPVPHQAESHLLGFRTRARSVQVPAVLFEVLRLAEPGVR